MGVLLLNASYEALRVIPYQRAINLVLQSKADIITPRENEHVISSTGEAVMEKPDVIKLRYYVNIPFKAKVPLNNHAVLNRDKFTCVYCGSRATTVDHVHPKSKGGQHDWYNVVASCRTCNGRKADRLLHEIGWSLPRPPAPPEASKWIFLSTKPRKAWEEWLK